MFVQKSQAFLQKYIPIPVGVCYNSFGTAYTGTDFAMHMQCRLLTAAGLPLHENAEGWIFMVYIIVAIVLFFLTVKGYCGKRTGNFVRDTGDSFLFNLLRMVFCLLIGMVFVWADGAQSDLKVKIGMLLICALAGAANAAFLVGWLMAIRRNSYVLVDVGLTLGSLLPAVLSAFLFGDSISPLKMIGFTMILAATVILSKNTFHSVRVGWTGIVWLVVAALGDGLSGFAQQLFKQFYTEAGTLSDGVYYPKTVYHFYTYCFSAVLLLLIWVGYRLATREKGQTNEAPQKRKAVVRIPPKVVAYIFVMAICLFAANYLQTVAANDYGMSSQVLYPILKGGCLITGNVVAMAFFDEKITRYSIIGSAVALCGIVCINLL